MSFAGASLLRMYTAPTAHSRYLQAYDRKDVGQLSIGLVGV
jgi:hypothetical protein